MYTFDINVRIRIYNNIFYHMLFTLVLTVDTPNDEDTSSSLEICDDTALRGHAMRLNPSYYANTCFAPVTSTPNTGNNCTPHNPNAKKSVLNFNDDGKIISPRKHSTPGTPTCANTSTASLTSVQCLSPNNASAASSTLTTTTLTTTATTNTNTTNSNIISDSNADTQISQQLRDKRKSPTKKIRSPVSATRTRPSGNTQPMVVVYEHNPAIACAKKLQSLIAEDDYEGEIDNKDRIAIVACAKVSNSSVKSPDAVDSVVLQSHEHRAGSPHTPPLLTVTKLEHSDNSDDLEFIPENVDVTHSFTHNCFDTLQQKRHLNDGSMHEAATTTTSVTAQTSNASYPAATNENYTEDCKLEVVATLSASAPGADAATCKSTHTSVKASTAWTREEDKLILIEMKLSAGIEKEQLFKRMHEKLPDRSLAEVKERYNFLIDFLSKLQGK